MLPTILDSVPIAQPSHVEQAPKPSEVQCEMVPPSDGSIRTTQEFVPNKDSNPSEGCDARPTYTNAAKSPDTFIRGLQISENSYEADPGNSNTLPGRPLDPHVPEGTLDTRSDERRIRELRTHAAKMCSRFEHSSAMKDLDEAINHWKAAISLTTVSHPDRPGVLSDIGCAYLSRFQNSGKLPDLNAAINYGELAISLTPDDHESKPARLGNLGVPYAIRFQRLGELDDLDKAIDCGERAVSLASDGDSSQLVQLSNLGDSYRVRFVRLGELSDLNKAIEYGEQSVSLTPDGDAAMPGRLSNLGNSYQARFGRLGQLPDLNKAIECGVQAVSLLPVSHTDRPSIVNNLGSSYRLRFSRLGEPSDMDKAIECGDQAVSLTPDGHPDMPGRLHNLGIWYRTRFGHLGELPDLNKSIECGAQAVSLTPDGYASKPGRLNSVGNSYRYRFERLGELTDLDKAIDCSARAVALTPEGHTSEPGQLSNLGVLYRTRFERLGDLLDLSQAIQCGTRAVSLTPDGHPDKSERLSSLGNAYRTRFGCLGEIPDLNKAIECGARAVTLTPDDHSDKSTKLNNLGISYRTRFQRLGELIDLKKAIDCGAQSVLLTAKDHADRPGRLSNLGNSYLVRFGRLGDPVDLNRTIDCREEAILLVPDAHTDKAGMLSDLGNAYLSRFEHGRELSDVIKGIDYATQALSLVPDGHVGKPGSLQNLANAYRLRFTFTAKLKDLDKAIELESQAVSLTLNGDVAKPIMFNFLGDAYSSRFHHTRALSDLESAINYLKDAAQSSGGSPSHRFKSCRKWAQLASYHTDSLPYPAYKRAMDLLPQLIWIGTTLGQRYSTIQDIGDFATEAASYAISINNYELALEWLEAGRSIVWGQIAQLRTPFDELFAHDPDLANKLKETGHKLEHAGAKLPSIQSFENDASDQGGDIGRHSQLALDWDMYLSQARAIPGLQDFLNSHKASKLLSFARSQPIAIINVHKSRCDALILQPNNKGLLHVPLPRFSPEDAIMACEQLAPVIGYRGFSKANKSKPGSLSQSLKGLWLGVVQPVLDSLGYMHKLQADKLPGITWCTTGLLSFLPLHAAGCYEQSQHNAFDFVISSYTPTLSALLPRQPMITPGYHGVLAVGQEHTPGLDDLPCVNQELNIIKNHAQAVHYMQLSNNEATVDRVLGAMRQFSWVHMACHGTQNPLDPTQSAFHLCDGNLTLEMLTKQSFRNKGLAFLSACQTAQGDQGIPEEAVHLAAGMLMAGYPSVIGTMWSIADEDGPSVANEVYSELLKDGKMDHTGAARALHKAVAHLREIVGETAISRWAPFIHIGT